MVLVVPSVSFHQGVRIYGVQCYQNSAATPFYRDLADMTSGKHLNLKQFDTIVDMMMAICYREHDPNFLAAYEKEVRAREGLGIRPELDTMFAHLRGADAGESTSGVSKVAAAAASAVPATLTPPATPPSWKGKGARTSGKRKATGIEKPTVAKRVRRVAGRAPVKRIGRKTDAVARKRVKRAVKVRIRQISK